MSEKDIKMNQSNEPSKDKTEEDSYYSAKAAQYKGRKQPCKRHKMKLVYYVEEDGMLYPVYRDEQ